MSLILTRKAGESIYIGDDIKITVVEMKGPQVRIGVDAPAKYRIFREEIYLQILEENKSASQPSSTEDVDQFSGNWRIKNSPSKPQTKGMASLKPTKFKK